MKYNVGDTVWVVSQHFDQRWVSKPSKISDIMTKDNISLYLVDVYMWGLFGEDLKLKELYTDNVFETKEECDEYISNHYYDNQCRGCKYDEIDCNWTCDDCKFNSDLDSCKRNGASTSRNEICKYYTPTLPQNIRNWGGADWYVDLQKNCLYNKECSLHKNSIHKTCTYEQWANQFKNIYYPNTKYKGREITNFTIKKIDWWNSDFYAYGFDKKNNCIEQCVMVNGVTFAPLKTPSGKDKKGTCNQGLFWEDGHILRIGGENDGESSV